MKLRVILLMLVTGIIQQCILAQSKFTLSNVYSVQLRNTGPIISGEEVRGYFFFYQTDKVDKLTSQYTLQILDENLNNVREIKFTDAKNVFLLESSYNGTDIMFMFYNEDERQVTYRVYGTNGEQRSTFRRIIDRRTMGYIEQYFATNKEQTENNSIFSVDGKGFITTVPIQNGSNEYTYEVNFYASNTRRQWTYQPERERLSSFAQYLGNSDSVAVFEVSKRRGFSAKVAEIWLVGVYLHNGQKAFEFTTEQEKYHFFPMNVASIRNNGKFLLLGLYFEKNGGAINGYSLGLGVWNLDNQGNVLKQGYNSWTTDISKFLKTNRKGRVDELGYIHFHRIIQMRDGKIFAVGEGFSNAGDRRVKITDMLLLQFDQSLAITDARIFEKTANYFQFPNLFQLITAQTMGMKIKAYEGFDYSFSQSDRDRTLFSVGYTDYVRTKDYKGLTFNTISYYNNDLTTDKIELSTKATQMRIYPAKIGSVMVLEYFKRDKRLEMRLEKIN